MKRGNQRSVNILTGQECILHTPYRKEAGEHLVCLYTVSFHIPSYASLYAAIGLIGNISQSSDFSLASHDSPQTIHHKECESLNVFLHVDDRQHLSGPAILTISAIKIMIYIIRGFDEAFLFGFDSAGFNLFLEGFIRVELREMEAPLIENPRNLNHRV